MDDVFEEELDAELFGSEDDDEEQQRGPKKRGRGKAKGKGAAGAGEEEEEEQAEDIYANEGEDSLRPEMPDNVSGGAGDGDGDGGGMCGAVLHMFCMCCTWPAGHANPGATA